MKRYVAYLWPSTTGDTADLDAQRAEIARFVSFNDGRIAGEHTEEDCSWRSTWPNLAEAITQAKDGQAVLVIGKVDHLVNNATFTRMLLESGVDFVCCDNQLVHRKTIHIFADMAGEETRRISARTKAGLSAAKARGVKLGSAREGHWHGREDRRRAGIRRGQPKAAKAAAEARSKKAREAYSGLMPSIIKMREEEGLTMAKIAERLNAEGHKTTAGLPFSSCMITRLLQRAGKTQRKPPAPPQQPAADCSATASAQSVP